MPNTRARELRTAQTDAEHRLWAQLRDRRLAGYKFRRQRPLGPYIVDFVCIEHRLIIEADGGQHAGSGNDLTRTAWLEGEGWTVMRFWNNDILENMAGVLERIGAFLTQQAATPPLPPAGEGGARPGGRGG